MSVNTAYDPVAARNAAGSKIAFTAQCFQGCGINMLSEGGAMIRFNCPGCSKSLKVLEKHTGKRGKCPQCGRSLNDELSPATTSAAAGDSVSDLAGPRLSTGETDTDFDKMLDEVLFQSPPTVPSTDPLNAEFLAPSLSEAREAFHDRSEWESLVDSSIYEGSASHQSAADSSHTAYNQSSVGDNSLSGRVPGFLQTSEGFGSGIIAVALAAFVILSKIFPGEFGHDATRHTFDSVEVFVIHSNKSIWAGYCVLATLVICLLFGLHSLVFCKPRGATGSGDAIVGLIVVVVPWAIGICFYLKPTTTIDRVSVAQDTVKFTSRASTRTVARGDIRDVQIFRDKFRKAASKGRPAHDCVSYIAGFTLADGSAFDSTAIATRLSDEQRYRDFFKALRARLTD